jgi:5'-nucleotidase
VGLLQLAPTAEWVLSGINHGGNLGADVYYSGTVAAVREAVLHGWPGVAFSHYRKPGRDFAWARVTEWARRVLAELLAGPRVAGLFYNVNFPHLESHDPAPDIVYCRLDPHPLPLSYRHEEDGLWYNANYHTRERVSGGDVDVCFAGQIAVTEIRLY